MDAEFYDVFLGVGEISRTPSNNLVQLDDKDRALVVSASSFNL